MMDVLLLVSFVLWSVVGWYCLRKPTGPSRSDYAWLLAFFLLHILALFVNSVWAGLIP